MFQSNFKLKLSGMQDTHKTAHCQAPEKSHPIRLFMVKNPTSQTSVSSGHLGSFTYLMLVAGSWIQKAIEGIFVGCCEFKKAYRIWIESKRKIEISQNVVVDQSKTYHSLMLYNQLPSLPPSIFSFRQQIWSKLMSCLWKLKIKP